jgi:hypothetical protein
MLDALYVAITVVFFGMMLAYVRVCEALGSDRTDGEDRT